MLYSISMEEERYYRYIEEGEPQVGDILPTSYVWDGDEWTDEQLPGTCCFSSIQAIIEYSQWCETGWIVIVSGDPLKTGELPYEVIIREAEVISVFPVKKFQAGINDGKGRKQYRHNKKERKNED